MNKLKKLILLISTVVLCNAGYAKVIDLDRNPDTCRQQIFNSPDEFPIILSYYHDCEWAQKFMPVYETVAKEHPERTFYRFDFQNAKTQYAQCIDQLGGSLSPQLRVIWIVKDSETGEKYRLPPLRVDGEGTWTKEDVVKFISVTGMTKKLSTNNRSPISIK